jgi:CBS-domain-containing membrane protein
MSLAAWVTGMPVVVPSLGASLLLAAAVPETPESTPTTLLLGHWIAIAAALVALEALGLWDAPSTLAAGVTWTRMVALPLALALALLGMLVVGRLHTPAGATAMLVASSIVRPGSDLLILAATVAYVAGVVALFPYLTAQLAGRPVPASTKRRSPPRSKRRSR